MILTAILGYQMPTTCLIVCEEYEDLTKGLREKELILHIYIFVCLFVCLCVFHGRPNRWTDRHQIWHGGMGLATRGQTWWGQSSSEASTTREVSNF